MNHIKAQLEASKAAKIKQVIADANALDDEELIHDMIEGETSFYEVMDSLTEDLFAAETIIAAIKDRLDALTTRKRRIESQRDKIRDLMRDCMNIAGERKIVLPQATISLGAKSPKATITDESLLPDELMRVKREPDLRAIAERIKAGGCVSGAVLSNGGESLIIRNK